MGCGERRRLGDDRLCGLADTGLSSSFHPFHFSFSYRLFESLCLHSSSLPFFDFKIIGNSFCFPACRSHFPFALYVRVLPRPATIYYPRTCIPLSFQFAFVYHHKRSYYPVTRICCFTTYLSSTHSLNSTHLVTDPGAFLIL